MLQRTLSRCVWFEGIGLHCGRRQRIKITPKPSNTGIRFITADDVAVTATFRHVQRPVILCTKLVCPQTQASVQTIEHLMAAFASLNIHNADVHFLSHPPHEVPAMDGSSLPFMRILAPNVTQSAPHHPVEQVFLHETLTISDETKHRAVAEPYAGKHGLKLVVSVDDFKGRLPLCRPYEYWYDSKKSDFLTEIAGARTLVFESEVEQLMTVGLGLGGSLRNCVVYRDEPIGTPRGRIEDVQVLNRKGLRFKDEWLRHKVLDCIGDLALFRPCARLHAKLTLNRPGHQLNNDILWKIAESLDNQSRP